MKRPRSMIRGFCAIAVVASTTGLEDHYSLVRRVQGFGVGVVVDTTLPEDSLTSLSPTPMPIATNTEPSTSPTIRSSNTPSTLTPSVALSAVINTPLPTPASTGGGILLEDGIPASSPALPPDALNFYLEFQVETRNGVVQADIIDQVEVSLVSYLSTFELSLDTEQTLSPMQVIGIESIILGMCLGATRNFAVLTQAFRPGPCPSPSSDLSCQFVRMEVSTRVTKVTKHSDLAVAQIVRNKFVPSFNAESSDCKLVYEYPILAIGVLRFAIRGPTREMDDAEMGYFAAFAERRVVAPIIDELANAEYSLRSVDWTNEHKLDVATENDSAASDVDDVQILVQLFVLATCRNELQCTSANFQDHIEEAAGQKTDSLSAALVAVGGDVPYFSQIETIQFLSRDNKTSRDVGETQSQASSSNNGGRISTKHRIPLWVWMLIVADFAVLVSVFAYVSHRRNKRNVQGDKMKDSPEEKQHRKISLQVTPFNNRLKSEQQVAKTAEQIEEAEYDAHSYDFSVDAGDLSDANSDVEISSIRKSRIKR